MTFDIDIIPPMPEKGSGFSVPLPVGKTLFYPPNEKHENPYCVYRQGEDGEYRYDVEPISDTITRKEQLT
jgi:hypothetical protein